MEHKGIVMEIVKELSRALNFSYYLHEASAWKEEDSLSTSAGGNESVGISSHFLKLLEKSNFRRTS